MSDRIKCSCCGNLMLFKFVQNTDGEELRIPKKHKHDGEICMGSYMQAFDF